MAVACVCIGTVQVLPQVVRGPSRAAAPPLRFLMHCWIIHQLLLQCGRSMEYDSVIVCDLGRAIPTVPFFGTSEHPGEGQTQLYRILTAYAHLDKRVGYCQGMHFIAALLLLCGLSETNAFYTFASLMLRWVGVWHVGVNALCHELRMCARVMGPCRFGLAGLYGPGLPMLHTSHLVISALIGHRRPALFKHLHQHLGLAPSLYATPWLMSGFMSSALPLSTCVALLDILLCEQEPGPIPALIASTFTTLQALYPHLAVIVSPVAPVRGPPSPVKSQRRLPLSGTSATPSQLSATEAGNGSPTRVGPAGKKGKSAMKGARLAAQVEAAGDEQTRHVVSLLPTVYIRAALVILVKLEGQLVTTGCLEEAMSVLKCIPASVKALMADLMMATAQPSPPMISAPHPHTATGASPESASRRKSNLTHGTDMGEEADGGATPSGRAPKRSSTTTATAASSSVVPASSPTTTSAIAQFVKTLELLDAIDDPYVLTESLQRDKKKLAAFPALPPNVTPEEFLTTPLAPTDDMPATSNNNNEEEDSQQLNTDGSEERKEKDLAPQQLQPVKSVGSMASIEEIGDDAVARVVASVGAGKLGQWTPNVAMAKHLSLVLPQRLPPQCDYKLDDGRVFAMHGSKEAPSGGSPVGGLHDTTPSTLMMMSSSVTTPAEHLCDGKLVHVWMLPRQFRALMNTTDMTIRQAEFEAAVRASNRLSLATILL